jgi:hypothetical protein
VHRLESALFNVSREKFYCIDKFNLDEENIEVTYKSEGAYTINRNEDFLQKEPVVLVLPYMIRTLFHSILDKSDRMNAFKIACEKKKICPPFEKNELRDNLPEWKKKHPRNIFNVSTFSKKYLYQFFCEETESVITAKKWAKNMAHKGFPEQYQVVMVASHLLQSVFGEEGLHATLMSDLQRKEKEYKAVYGSLDNAMPLVHSLEAKTGQLPVGAKIIQKEFRRVISSNLASIASFIAFAIYDQESFNYLSVLLMKQTPEELPNEHKAFPSGDMIFLALPDEVEVEREQYLFNNERLDDGNDFVANVVQVLTHFGEFLKTLDKDPFRHDGLARVHSMERIQGLVFRTLASDLVEIYVLHGCYPDCTRTSLERHPRLMEFMKKFKGKHKLVPLLFHYIIFAIQYGTVKVASSHNYNSQGTLQITMRDTKQIDPVGQKDIKTPNGIKRPATRDIRYYYQLAGAAKPNGDTFDEWLTLTEVVNVILFSVLNPWKRGAERYEEVEWVPKFEKALKVGIWTKPKQEKAEGKKEMGSEPAKVQPPAVVRPAAKGPAAEEKEKQQGQVGRNKPNTSAGEDKEEDSESEKGESQGQDAVQDADNVQATRSLFQSREEIELGAGGASLPSLGAGVASLPSQHEVHKDDSSDSDVNEVQKRRKRKPVRGKRDKNDEADESQAGMHTMDEDLVQKPADLVPKSAEEQQEIDVKVHEKLVEVSDMVMELINMGQGQVDERYPMILQSIKNMSTTLVVLTGLQQRLMAANASLSIAKQEDDTYDIGKVLLELQNFMVNLTQAADGIGMISVNYGGDQIDGAFNVIQRIYGYLENVVAGMAMMPDSELSTSALRYQQRDGPRIVFQEPSIRSKEKMCIWTAKEEEQSSQQGTKRKRPENEPLLLATPTKTQGDTEMATGMTTRSSQKRAKENVWSV